MTFGGVSKASKGVNLSEDIFAGFSWVLRGGRSTQADYIQARSMTASAVGGRGDPYNTTHLRAWTPSQDCR
jgi:hypothetical protein